MVEDKAFNAFLKGKLEEDLVVPEVRAAKSSWWRPVLMAASLAVVCGVFSWQVVRGRNASLERSAAQAIEVLGGCETAAGGEFEESFADRLLAWQDAPFVEISDL